MTRIAPKHPPILLDFAIMGAGVAGLWLANLLQNRGFSVAVFDQRDPHTQAAGQSQTLASQGMIHGGMKYTLGGGFTQASEAIADMPQHWRDCLCSSGEVDLRHTRILSDHFYLWSSASVTSKLATFLASKLTRGRVAAVNHDSRPPLLRHPDFSGHLYKLDDLVIDTRSLVANLEHNLQLPVLQLPPDALLERSAGGATLRFGEHQVQARQFILCAGAGNESLLTSLGLTAPAMQRRPLQQVMVKHKLGFDFYGHCLGAETTPRLTISSHRTAHGDTIWYLGGSLAERGAALDSESLIALAKAELAELIPWADLHDAEWATLPIERAEPAQPKGARPNHAFLSDTALPNCWVAWPTKLTLTPNLGALMNAKIDAQALVPQHPLAPAQAALLQTLVPTQARAMPWDIRFTPAESEIERLTRLLLPDGVDGEDAP